MNWEEALLQKEKKSQSNWKGFISSEKIRMELRKSQFIQQFCGAIQKLCICIWQKASCNSTILLWIFYYQKQMTEVDMW